MKKDDTDTHILCVSEAESQKKIIYKKLNQKNPEDKDPESNHEFGLKIPVLKKMADNNTRNNNRSLSLSSMNVKCPVSFSLSLPLYVFFMNECVQSCNRMII